jgi:N-acyl-L-homoserine lactone synthetase
MSLQIKLASTAAELDALFRARHRVFIEQMKYGAPQPDGRCFDRFDAFPGTVNFVAVCEDEIVGGVRGVEMGTLGTPADAFFDFHPHLPRGARVNNAGMFFVSPQARNRARIMFWLQGLGFLWAQENGYTHLTTIAAPLVESMHQRVGWRPLAERFVHAQTGLHAMPMVVDLGEVHPRLMSFVVSHRLPRALERFERHFFRKGDPVAPLADEKLAYLPLVGEFTPELEGAGVSALTDLELAVIAAPSVDHALPRRLLTPARP